VAPKRKQGKPRECGATQASAASAATSAATTAASAAPGAAATERAIAAAAAIRTVVVDNQDPLESAPYWDRRATRRMTQADDEILTIFRDRVLQDLNRDRLDAGLSIGPGERTRGWLEIRARSRRTANC
jgi:hypothetical protein